VGARDRSRPRRWYRSAVAVAVTGLLTSGLVATVAPSAQADVLNVRGDSDSIQGLVTTATSNVPNTGNEGIDKLADRNPGTKWYASGGGNPSVASPVYAIYTLSQAAEATAYAITAGSDSAKFPERDPKDWTVLGSNTASAAGAWDDSSWQVVDTRSGQAFASNGLTKTYTAASPASYKYYQLRVTAKQGTTSNLQIADWTLRAGQQGYTSSVITSTTQWSYLNDPTGAVDPANGAADRTAWTKDGASLPGTWTTAAGPFGAKRGSTNLGTGFPVTTTLPLDRGATQDNVVPAYFFRTTFELDQAGLSSIKGLYGTLLHDDAATVYLNGTPVATYNEGSTITENLSYGGGTLGDPRSEALSFPADALKVGTNVLSVEVHNVNATSSDVYFAMPSLAATSDALPVPFTPDEINATYASSTVPSTFFSNFLTGFEDIKNNPAVIAPNTAGPENNGTNTLTAVNDRVTVAINQGGAGSDQYKVDKRAQAVYDADNNSYIAMTDALGSVLGPIYRQALQAGKLPKTKWLLDNVENSSYEAANNAAKGLWASLRPMNRLGFTTGGTCSSGVFPSTQTGWIEVNYTSKGGYDGLCGQGSFPSGHTYHGYDFGTVMATLLPELSSDFLWRSSEYGNNRILLGFHYTMDVMAGRIVGQATSANRWSDPAFRALLLQATSELRDTLGDLCVEAGQSHDLVECAEAGTGIPSLADEEKIYTERLAYSSYTTTDGTRHTDGFPIIFSDEVAPDAPLIVPTGASNLLLTTFPSLTDAQRDLVLQATALPAGYALDKTKDGEPSWQRVNLLAAMQASVTTDARGNLVVNGKNMGGGTPLSTDATLSAIKVDGTPLADFSGSKTSYDVVLPAGTKTAPQVTATTTDPNAEIGYIQAASLPGTALVRVTAEDGQTQQAYSVNFTVAPDGGGNPGGTTVRAILTAATAITTYGKPATVAVTVTAPGTIALGTVRVSEGSALLGSGVLVAGRVNVTLPATLDAGLHTLSVTYVPLSSEIVAPAPRTLSLMIGKADAKLGKVKVTKGKHGKNKVAKGKKATLKVVLKGVAAPTGKVKVKVGKKVFGKATLKKSGKKGVAVVKTKALKKKGKIKVVYAGSSNLTKKTFTTKVKVK